MRERQRILTNLESLYRDSFEKARAGQLTNLDVRVRFDAGQLSMYPSLGYSVGNLYDPVSGAAIDLAGFRSSVTIRFN